MDGKKEPSPELFIQYEDIMFNSGRLPKEMNDISYDDYNNDKKFVQLIKNKAITPNNLNEVIKNEFSDKLINYEFENLKQITDSDSDHYNSLVNNTDDYDRYSDIRPYQYNFLKLSDKTYINSSRIHGALPSQQNMFIATQGPKENTQKHFWQMVIENNVNLIIMLCKLRENDREKCYHYWPSSNCSKKFEDFKISNEQETEIVKGLVETKFSIYKGEKKYEVTHLIYSLWPDHGVPVIKPKDDVFEKIIGYVDKFYNIWDNNLQNNKFSPIIVHCSAGVGRTGTFMSIYNIYSSLRYQQMYLNQNPEKEKTVYINVFNTVRKIKEQRLISVENILQYKFIISHTVNMLIKILK